MRLLVPLAVAALVASLAANARPETGVVHSDNTILPLATVNPTVFTNYVVSSADGGASCAVVDISNANATLDEAQTGARKKREGGALCVNILLGTRTFKRTETLQLSGANDSNTNWIGGELTAGIDVPPTMWKVGTSSTNTPTAIADVNTTVKSVRSTLTLNLLQLGLGSLSSGNLVSAAGHLQLLVEVNGVWRPMTLARWPNVEFEYIEVPPVNWTTVNAVPNEKGCGSTCRSFQWANDTNRPARWVAAAAEGRLFVQGFFKYLWRDSRVQINNVYPSSRIMSTASPTISASGVYPGAVYYAYGNLHEELDVPGEFAVDNRTDVLSAILPTACFNGTRVVCRTRVVPITSPSSLVTITAGAKNITLQNIILTGNAGAGISISAGSENITLEHLQVNNVVTGVNVDQTNSGVSLSGSDVGYTMLASTSFSGGDRATLTPPGFRIESNRLHDFGRWVYTYQAGVHVGGVGVVVRKNLFYSSYHVALLFSGNNHLFELNEFRNVATIGYDTGAVYGGRDLSSRGTVIRHNFFHHLDNPSRCNDKTSCIRQAIYVDDFEGGVEISGNIFYKMMNGFFSNCGGDFNFSNNLFVDVGTPIRQDGRDEFGSVQSLLYTTLFSVPFTSQLWKAEYPELSQRFAGWKNNTPPPPGTTAPRNNIYALNAVVNSTGAKPVPGEGPGRFDNWTANADGMFSLPAPWYTAGAANTTQYFAIKGDNLLSSQPGFASADPTETLDFALQQSSPLFKLGWQRIPQEDIGPE